MNRVTAIKTLEKVLHLKLSKQQKKIVDYNYQSPVLVNACAGAGKTTLLLFNILLSIMTKEYKPNHIIGITFSKRAQLDMRRKFYRGYFQLRRAGIKLSKVAPTFSTFDALFYHLLQLFPEYSDSKVLSSPSKLNYYLFRALKKSSKELSEREELQQIFDTRNALITNGYTYDGYHLLGVDSSIDNFQNVTHKIGFHLNDDFFINYLSVAKTYIDLKEKYEYVDFNDMKIMLVKKVNDTLGKELIKKRMRQYQVCFIDEFQDIDALQWFLMKNILSKSALNKLTVIGDDDQSIYAFRGSKPEIILNYTKNYPKVHRFDLSMNYRTNRNVLKVVRPLINHNKCRMNKKLLAKRNVRGGVYEFISRNRVTGGDLLLSKALQMYYNPKYRNSDLAILVRFNSDRIIAIDWLANHKIYVPSVQLLQNNSIYRTFFNIASAMCFDSLKSMRAEFRVLGFNQYYYHMKKVAKEYYPHDDSLINFYKNVQKYDKEHKRQLKREGLVDKIILNTIVMVQSQKVSGADLFSRIKAIVKKYYNFMIRKNYMSKVIIEEITNYIGQEMSSFKDIRDFVFHEYSKIAKFKSSDIDKKKSPINVLTIHQSKGLQFKYVFLYNLTNRNLSDKMQEENYYFAPDASRKDFLLKLVQLNEHGLSDLDGNKKKVTTEQKNTPYHNFRFKINFQRNKIVKHCKNYSQDHFKHSWQHIANSDYKVFLEDIAKDKSTYEEIQKSFNTLYENTINDSFNVEEERRLIYVGITRAQNSVILNVGNYSNPLLNELKIEPHHVLGANKNGVATIVKKNENPKYLLSMLGNQINKVKNKADKVGKKNRNGKAN